MSGIQSLLIEATVHLKPYSAQIAVALVATLLVIYGHTINRTLRALVKPYHFVIRVMAFVLLCTLGYGLITVWGVHQVKVLIAALPSVYFTPVIVLVFIVLGILAERFNKN